MARPARIKKSNNGTARYHLMSRTNDRRFLFAKGRIKTQLVDALKRAAAFSGVELEAYVVMDNHFHIVCKVVRGGEELTEGELLRRIAALKGERAAAELAEHWKELRGDRPHENLIFQRFPGVFCGDRPHESLIFQCFPDIGPATAPILAAFAGFPPGGDPLNEFIFDSFFFSRNVV